MNDSSKKKTEPEVIVMTAAFILLSVFVLISIVAPWGMEAAAYCYAVIALVGVITCARSKAFMAVDVLTEMYPESLKKGVYRIRDIIMVLIFALMFVIAVLGFMNQMANPTASETLGIPNIILYGIQMVVYPVAAIFYAMAMKAKKGEE